MSRRLFAPALVLLALATAGCGGGGYGGGFGGGFVPLPFPVAQNPTTFFFTEPGNVGFNAFENPPIQVGVADAFGNPVPGVSVTIALNNGGNGALLSGTVVQTTDFHGVATFPNLSINKAGSYTLTASASGFFQSTSSGFTVLPGSGSVGTAVTQSVGSHPVGIVSADFNQDLLPDVAVTNQNDNTVTVLQNATQTQGGTINLVSVQTLSTGTGPTTVAAQDLNHSGFPSIVTANSGTTTLSVFQNLTGSVGGQTLFNSTAITLAVGHTPVAVAIGDVNGDGLPDIVTANSDGSVSIFINASPTNGTLAFNGPQTITLTSPSALGGVAIGNLNGSQDIVVTRPTGQEISVLLNQGGTAPTFTETDIPTTMASPTGVTLADLNQDGRTDMAVSSSSTGSVDIFFNQSATATSITTQQSILTNVGTGATSLQLVDMNGDAVPDLEVASTGNSTVQVLLNNTGVGSFTASFSGPTAFSTLGAGNSGQNPVGLTVVDLNQDGLPDFVTANQTTNDISVLTGH